MRWQHSKKNSFIMLYGFESSERHYDAVLTLHPKKSETTVYGFVSKVKLNVERLFHLWIKLKELYNNKVITQYLLIEVLPDHAGFYKMFTPVVSIKKKITFNNLECELLKIDLSKDLKHKQQINKIMGVLNG
jgi:hypothetical protein